MHDTPYQIVVFGKAGCQKCHTLNQRIDKLLAKDEWSDFSKHYLDILTEEGLVEFCNAECINPQRIPACLFRQYDKESGKYLTIEQPQPGKEDEVCKDFALYTYLGLQTDYSSSGTITPKMLTKLMEEARNCQVEL